MSTTTFGRPHEVEAHKQLDQRKRHRGLPQDTFKLILPSNYRR